MWHGWLISCLKTSGKLVVKMPRADHRQNAVIGSMTVVGVTRLERATSCTPSKMRLFLCRLFYYSIAA